MKILYLDLNIKYHNPTRSLIPPMLQILNEVDIYGPGYQSDLILEKGIENFYAENGPYDIVCSNEHISIFYPESKLLKSGYLENLDKLFYFNFHINRKHLDDMSRFFVNLKTVPKILFLLEFDKYWLPDYRINLLEELDAFIVGYGTDFEVRKDNTQYLQKESFKDLVNDNWWDFVNKHEHKVIQLVHFMDNSEFEWSNLNNRKYECGVLGTGYWSRQVAIQALRETDIKLPSRYLQTNKIYDILRRYFGYHANAKRLGIYLNNKVFNNMIEDSISSYTCGSANMQPLRKFFEIPSKGTVLICLPFAGFEKLGFKNNENCITVSHPEEVVDVVYKIRNNIEWANQLAKKGRDMVFNNHSINSRATQLDEVFKAIIQDTLKRTYWHNGQFIVEK